MKTMYQNSVILNSEIVRLKRQGFSLVEIARQMMAMKAVISHWALYRKLNSLGHLPLP
jgi:hypothetical protein